MQQNDNSTREEKYDFICSQHGGYYRHDLVDHAYLYNLYFPPEEVFTHFKDQVHELVLNYPVDQNVLAQLIGRIIGQPAERIVVGNGAAELIKIVSGHVSGKMIIPVPSFNEYVNAAPSGKVVEFPLEFPSFEFDIDKFADEALRSGADVAVMVSPNNPTSMLVPKADLIRLSVKLREKDCLLIVDQSFLDFAENPDDISLEKEIHRHPNLVILKSMSKAYGICGLRIGYMLTANSSFAEAVRKGTHIWNINGFAEEFLRVLPSYRQQFIESCQRVRKDRNKMFEEMNAIEGMTLYKPDANYIFCRLPDDVQSAPQIARALFIKHNILVKDCLGKSQPEGDRYLRIACRREIENHRLVEALIDVMAENRLEKLT